ncbi:AIR synthase-related protein [Butyrivibrio sp. AC2005]|uniref:AIR synthase-related protein n=1 Tax=Butyrivibrio sp. AC2005 TaxID=1280672 RepID=UPI00040EA337|nr:AIR synthase-related protein [Butyrivibrio sp. AC2005]
MRIGKVTESVLKRSVLKIIQSDSNKVSAAAKSDCAYSIDENGQKLLSSIATFTIASEDASYYAMHNAANNIFAMGGVPLMAVISILLPAEAEESELKNIMRSVVHAANDLGITIEGGHTEVSDAVKRPVITVNVTGKEVLTISENGNGLSIVMTKWAGIEGTAILSKNCHEKLSERLPDYMIREAQNFKELISIRKDAEVAIKNGAYYLHDISMGGIFAALWEIAERAKCGLEVDLKKIPIKQETVEITNHLGVNPYQLVSGGALLLLAPDGEAVVRALENEGIAATVIGVTTDKNDRIIRNDDEVRYLDKPQADEIVRFMV